jgi:hypothetical protein
VPVENGDVSAVTLSHYRWIGLDPMSTSSAPYDQACAGRSSAAECRGWAGVGLHCRDSKKWR